MNNSLLPNPESDDHATVLLAKCEELLEDACLYGHLYETLREETALGEEAATMHEQMDRVVNKYKKKGQPNRPSVLPYSSLESQFHRLTVTMRPWVWGDETMSDITETYGVIQQILSITEGNTLPAAMLKDLCKKVAERWRMRKHVLLDEKITFTTQKLLEGSKGLEILEEWVMDEATGIKEIFKRKLKKFFEEINELCDLSSGELSVLKKKTILQNMRESIPVMETLEKQVHTLILGTKEEINTTLCCNPEDPDQLEYRQDIAEYIGAKYVGMFREENGWYASYTSENGESGKVYVSGRVIPAVEGNAVYYKDKDVFLGKDKDKDVLWDAEGNILSSYSAMVAYEGTSGTFFLGIKGSGDVRSVDFLDSKGMVCATIDFIADGLNNRVVQFGKLLAIQTKKAANEVSWMLYNERGEILDHPCFPAYSFEEIAGTSVYHVKKIYTHRFNEVDWSQTLQPDVKTYIYWNHRKQRVGQVDFPKYSKIQVQYPWIYAGITSKRENSFDGIMMYFHNMLSGETIETDHIANTSLKFLTSDVQTTKGPFQELLSYPDKDQTVPQYAVGIETRGSQYGDIRIINSVVTVKRLPEYKNEPLILEVTYASMRYKLCVHVEDNFFQKKFHPILELLPHEIRDQVGEFIKNHRLRTNLYHRAAIEEIWIEPEMEAVLFLRGGSLYMYKQGKEELLHDRSTFYLASHSRPFRKGSDGLWRTLMDRPVISHPKEYFLTLSLDAPAGKRVDTGSLNRVIQAGEGLFWVVHYDKTEQPTGSVALYDECYQYLMTMGESEATEICDLSGELPQFRDGVVKFGEKGQEYYLSKKGKRVF